MSLHRSWLLFAIALLLTLLCKASPVGAAISSSSETVVYAWPNDDTLNALAIGDTVPTTLLSDTLGGGYQEDSSGNYDYSATFSTTPPASDVLADGTVNVEVVLIENNIPIAVDDQTIPSTATSISGAVPGGNFTDASPAAPSTSASPDVGGVNSGNPCWGIYYASLGNDNITYVGATYSTTDGGTVDFDYATNATSHFQVGFAENASFSDFAGAGSMSKTESVSNTWNENFGQRDDSAGSYHYYMTSKVREYQMTCRFTGVYGYEIRDTGISGGGGLTSVGPITTSAGNCVQEQAGLKPTTSSEKAETFSSGLQVPLMGLDLGTQQGFGTDVSIAWTFNVSRWLCGSDNTPPQARSVQVQSSQ